MEVIVSGGLKSKKQYVAKAVEQAGLVLMSKRLCDSLTINIELVKNLVDREGIYGDCIWEDTDIRPREFTIRLDKNLEGKDFLTTLCHEMIHVKQYARNELRQLSRAPVHRWHKEYISDDTEYFDRPWEIEAHDLEEVLAKEVAWLIVS